MTDTHKSDHAPFKELLATAELAGALLDRLGIWFNVVDTDLKIRLWNRTAERLSGYRADEVIGHRRVWAWCYPDPEYRRSIAAKAQHIVQTREGVDRFQNVIHCRNGDERCMSWHGSPFVNNDGNVLGVLSLGYDVTEYEQTHHRLRHLNEELLVAIRRVFDGKPPQPLEAAVQPAVRHSVSTPNAGLLTKRENEVLVHIAEGLSNSAIASQLGVSDRTIRCHVSSILTKLRLNNRTQAALYAVRNGLVRLVPED